MRTTPFPLALACALATLAAKCVDYQDRLSPPDAEPPGDGGPGDAAVVPAVACAEPDQAHFLIQNRTFVIQCGCREPAGKTCTVAPGTTLVWRFADSEEHNVTSTGSGFPMSDDKLVGTYRITVADPGAYPYGCAIHAADMSGYAIVVE